MNRFFRRGDRSAPHYARKAALAGVGLGLAAALSGCGDYQISRSEQPLSRRMLALMKQKGVAPQSPMLIRAYKKESEFEVWKMRPDGKYVLLKTFPICRWSGQLGPKTREGDRQSPEGFYSITPAMMNPGSAYYLSFNVGYPNAYDRAHGATGGSVMVHGVCSSAGCFSMTDAQIAEIYALARESFHGGQRAIQMQSYPFHMTPMNLAKYRLDPNMAFWRQLERGNDYFEATRGDVPVGVCARHYVFGAKSADGQPLNAEAACPPLKYNPAVEARVARIKRAENAAVAALEAKTRPVRLVYLDGAQNPVFTHRFPDVSRPYALRPPVELALDDPHSRLGVEARTAPTAAEAKLAAAEIQQQEKAKKRARAAPRAPASKLSALIDSLAHGAPAAAAKGKSAKAPAKRVKPRPQKLASFRPR